MFINFIKSKLKLKAFFKAKYLIRQRMTSVADYLFHHEWLEKRKEMISSLSIYSFSHSSMHAFVHSASCLEPVRHCLRRRNTKVKMVPTTEFTVCQEDRCVNRLHWHLFPYRIVYKLQRWHKRHTHLWGNSFWRSVRLSKTSKYKQVFFRWVRVWRSKRTWGRGISEHEAQRPEPAKHGQALHQRPFFGLRTQKGEVRKHSQRLLHLLPPFHSHSATLARSLYGLSRLLPEPETGLTAFSVLPPGIEQNTSKALQNSPHSLWFYWAEQKAQAPYPRGSEAGYGASLLSPDTDGSQATAHLFHCPSGPRLQAGPACFHLPSFAHVSPTDQAVHPSLTFTSVLQGLAQGPLIWLGLAPSSLCQYCVRY